MGLYDYSVTDPQGNEVKMSDFKGKVVMVVNTATGCGFTPHYEPIEKMYEDYRDQGFEVLDIPCNQFKGQTPGTDEEILAYGADKAARKGADYIALNRVGAGVGFGDVPNDIRLLDAAGHIVGRYTGSKDEVAAGLIGQVAAFLDNLER